MMLALLRRLWRNKRVQTTPTKLPLASDGSWDLGQERDSWDERFAQELVGCAVLVGLTHLDPAGELIERTEFYGYVMWVDKRRGIQLRLEGKRDGETFNLPPDTRAFRPARLGQYRSKSTGEIIDDPDFTCVWT
jgi:hypothetical protein